MKKFFFITAIFFSSFASASNIQSLADYVSGQADTTEEKITLINSLVNQSIAYTSDKKFHGVSEFWQQPEAAWQAKAGDCEEFAMVKYTALKKAGINESAMRFIFLKGHVVLGVAHSNRILILDNQRQNIVKLSGAKMLKAFAKKQLVASVMQKRVSNTVQLASL